VAQVAGHVTELKSLNLDSMSVVLKPDSNTEIYLRLNQHAGTVEVQARCERGDFQSLNAHWEELQRSLASQGVRVSPLENSAWNPDALPGRAGDGFQQAPDQPPPQTREPVTELRPAPLKSEPARRSVPSTKAPASQGWESWA
jgi:hypothetical protein